jgi:hypothetical protein
MLEELQRRNYSEGTTRAHLQAVQQFAVHFVKSPDKIAPRSLQGHSIRRKELPQQSSCIVIYGPNRILAKDNRSASVD